SDSGPHSSAIARRRFRLGQPCDVLPLVQQPQGRPIAGGGGDAAVEAASSLQPAWESADHPLSRARRPILAKVSFLLSECSRLNGVGAAFDLRRDSRAAWGRAQVDADALFGTRLTGIFETIIISCLSPMHGTA